MKNFLKVLMGVLIVIIALIIFLYFVPVYAAIFTCPSGFTCSSNNLSSCGLDSQWTTKSNIEAGKYALIQGSGGITMVSEDGSDFANCGYYKNTTPIFIRQNVNKATTYYHYQNEWNCPNRLGCLCKNPNGCHFVN